MDLDSITIDPLVMGGKPCVAGTRVTVGTVVGLMASGLDVTRVLELYPYISEDDVRACLSYASWRSEELQLSLT